MSRPLRRKSSKDLKRQRDGLAKIEERMNVEHCAATDKRMYPFESDVLMAYRGVKDVPTRAYLCQFCGFYHATSQPLKTRPVSS